MVGVAKVRTGVWVPDSHLHAIALYMHCVNASLFKTVDQDGASVYLVTSDQCLWVVRAKDVNVSCNEDVEQQLLVLGMELDVEDRLANADPVFACVG